MIRALDVMLGIALYALVDTVVETISAYSLHDDPYRTCSSGYVFIRVGLGDFRQLIDSQGNGVLCEAEVAE